MTDGTNERPAIAVSEFIPILTTVELLVAEAVATQLEVAIIVVPSATAVEHAQRRIRAAAPFWTVEGTDPARAPNGSCVRVLRADVSVARLLDLRLDRVLLLGDPPGPTLEMLRRRLMVPDGILARESRT